MDLSKNQMNKNAYILGQMVAMEKSAFDIGSVASLPFRVAGGVTDAIFSAPGHALGVTYNNATLPGILGKYVLPQNSTVGQALSRPGRAAHAAGNAMGNVVAAPARLAGKAVKQVVNHPIQTANSGINALNNVANAASPIRSAADRLPYPYNPYGR